MLSGFLICGILIREAKAGDVSLARFYERRARRILPALVAMLIVTGIAGYALLTPQDLVDFCHSAMAVATFTANIWFWRFTNNYFAPTSDSIPLLHTWSLGVEEQFYLLFPLLFVLPGRRTVRSLRWPVFLGTLASLGLSAWLAQKAPAFQFYNLPARAWELGIGCTLAFSNPRYLTRPMLRESCAAAGIMCVAIAFISSGNLPPIFGQLLACGGVAMVLAAGSQGSSAVAWVLSRAPMVGLGVVSYSLYLWHWPLLVFGRYTSLYSPAFAVVLAIAFGTFSWYFIEQPFRKGWPARNAIFTLAASACGSIVFAAMIVTAFHGFPGRISASTALLLDDIKHPEHPRCHPIAEGWARCAIGRAEAVPTVVVWGDSHAEALTSGFDAGAQAVKIGGVLQISQGCPPLIDIDRLGRPKSCTESSDSIVRQLQHTPSIRHVVLIAHWNEYLANGSRIFIDRATSRTVDRALFATRLDQTIDAISAPGRTITLIIDMPDFDWDVPKMIYAMSRLGFVPKRPPTLDDFNRRNASVDRVFEQAAGRNRIRIVSLGPFLCRPGCAYLFDGHAAYIDQHHVSDYAALHQFAPIFARAVFPTR